MLEVTKYNYAGINNLPTTNPINFKAESSLERSGKTDEIVLEKPKKKKKSLGKIFAGIIGVVILTYGSIVLRRKLSKPSFDEIQKCFSQIFEKDLSTDEVKNLISKYKEICKTKDTDDFVEKMIAELKKDYGLENVTTNTKVNKLKDNSIKTAMERVKAGSANPYGQIDMNPGTYNNTLIRSTQGETFGTAFHEMFHLKQFYQAYKADPELFAKSVYANTKKTAPDEIEKAINQTIELNKKNGITVSRAEAEKLVEEGSIKEIRQTLDKTYNTTTRFAKDSKEYSKGVEYMNSYENYTSLEENMDDYMKNKLEEEAYKVSDNAEKIYKYLSSIWKL
ncbi:MAG: hypothetical protein E7Z89_06120 [Cyanobacteria bacterium SIG28]|nr:hypothetical protein [Cyanobacteria bacterium SIG28]